MKPDSTIHQLAIAATQSDPQISQALLKRDKHQKTILISIKTQLKKLLKDGCLIEVIYNYHLNKNTQFEDVNAIVKINHVNLQARVIRRRYV